MGEVLTLTKGLDILTGALFAWMEPLAANRFTAAAGLYWSAFVYHLFLGSEVSMLGTSIPIVMRFATTHGMNPLSVGMIWTFASAGKIFIYQSTVLVVGYSYGYFSGKDLLRMGLWLTIAEFVILLLLVGVYWPLLGIW